MLMNLLANLANQFRKLLVAPPRPQRAWAYKRQRY